MSRPKPGLSVSKCRLTPAFSALVVGSTAAFCFLVGAGEPAAETTDPDAKPTPPKPAATERPKIRYWLKDPDDARAGKRDAGAQVIADETPPPIAEDSEPLVIPEPVVGEGSAAQRAALMAEIKSRLQEAKLAYKQKNYSRVIAISRSILKADPRNIEAAEWLRNAQGRQLDADERVTDIAAERRDREAILETDEHAVRPPPRLPTLRPHWQRREEDPALVKRKSITDRLEDKVSVNFMNADLEYVLNLLFDLSGVNIIADPAAIEDKKLTLHVLDLPLREVLNFIVRNNEGLQFSVTEDAVWITASESDDLKKIMFPRVYPLHHGLVNTMLGGGMSAGEGPGGGGGGGTGMRGSRSGGAAGGAGGEEEEKSYLENVLKWLKEDLKDPQVFPEGSDYIIDRPSNQLVVFTTPSGHDWMNKFLDQFDQPPIQVLIKTRFLSIEAEGEKSIGVNIDRIATRIGDSQIGTETPTTPVDSDGDGVPDTGTGTTGGRNPFRSFAFTGGEQPINIPGSLGVGNVLSIIGRRTDPQFQVTLAALLNNRQTKILSEPQILAINNKEAWIDITTTFSFITDLRPVTTTQFGGNGTAATNVSAFVPEFDEEKIGFTLAVTPSVGRDLKTINLHLNPMIDSLAQGQQITQFQSFDVTQSQNSGVPPSIQRPTIDQATLETDVVLEDNGYVIIGGLLRNRHEVRERKIPGLHRIPYLGNLFKSKSRNVTKSNLMIIVEAQIITPLGRTYYKAPEYDDVDIRQGGTIRAPGQVSEVKRPDAVNSALGLVAPRPVPGVPGAPAQTRELPPPPRRSSEAGKTEAAAAEQPLLQPAPAKSVSIKKSEPSLSDVGEGAKGVKVTSARERMERLVKSSKEHTMRLTAATWSLSPEEEVESDEPADDARGELVEPDRK